MENMKMIYGLALLEMQMEILNGQYHIMELNKNFLIQYIIMAIDLAIIMYMELEYTAHQILKLQQDTLKNLLVMMEKDINWFYKIG